MRNYKVLFLVLFAASMAGFTACTKVSFQPLDPNQGYSESSEVKTFRNFPDVPYEEIGTLRAVGPDKDKLLESVRAKAMKVGAQAIVVKPIAERSNSYDSQFRSNEFGKVEYILEAVALRFKTPEK